MYVNYGIHILRSWLLYCIRITGTLRNSTGHYLGFDITLGFNSKRLLEDLRLGFRAWGLHAAITLGCNL